MDKLVLPSLLEKYLNDLWIIEKHLAYFYFSADEKLLGAGGDIDFYFPDGFKEDISCADLTPLLVGLLPFDEPEFVLPYVELREKVFVNIRILNDTKDKQYCVLFFDISQDVGNEEKIQQAKNDLHVLTEKHKKLMRQHVGDPVVKRIMQGQSGLNMDGQRQQVCTLFADVRAFTVFNEKHDSQEVIYTLNAYLNIMIQAVLEQGGIVDKIVGDGLMALFGVLESDEKMPIQAFNAALRIQERVKELIFKRSQQGLHPLGVGIGIATGPAVLGILGDKQRQAFSAIGHHVNLAQRLESQARAGEILLDQNSWAELSQTQKALTKVELQLKGMQNPVTAYSYQINE